MTSRHRDQLRKQGIAALWRSLERAQERILRERDEREALERRVAELERALGLGQEPRRVPLARAAQRLGVSRQHVQRLGVAGELDLVDLREPKAPRATWTVGLESLERLLAERRPRERPGRPGQRIGPKP